MGQSIQFACQDCASTKAAYRFFANDSVSEQDILSGHFRATQERFASSAEPILILQDTTTFSCQRDRTERIGFIGKICSYRDNEQRKPRTVCGMLMHSSLVVTTEDGLLGLAAIKFWTRTKFKGCNALKKTINPIRVPIEEKERAKKPNRFTEST